MRSFYTVVLQCAERRKTYTKPWKKINDKAAACWIMLWAFSCRRVFYLSGRKRKKEKREGGTYSHALYSKVVGLHVLNVKKNKIFFMAACLLLFLSLLPLHPQHTSEGLWGCTGLQRSSDVRVLQSQVFVFISTRINRLSRLFRDQDQVQLLDQKQDPRHV